MAKILVTGANGQLGKSLQSIAGEYSQHEFIFLSKSDLDITNQSQLKNTFKKHQPDYCINCAAYTNVEQAETEPKKAFLINAEGVKYLAENCAQMGCVLIQISTDYVFDGEKKAPYTIADVPNPVNQYGKSKLKGEQYIKELLTQYYIVRTSWLYHETFGKNFYKTIIEKAKKEKVLYVTDSQTGCPTNTVNVAYFLLSLINEQAPYGMYHFSDDEVMTWFDFAKKIVAQNSLKVEVNPKEIITKAKRPKYSVLR